MASEPGSEYPISACAPLHFHIWPNISMGRKRTAVLFSAFATPNVLLSIAFASTGYWPISVFASLTLLGLLFGLVFSRASLKRSERVYLREGSIVVERLPRYGRRSEICLPTYGLRLESRTDPDFGSLSLLLRHRTHSVEIARDLSPRERGIFKTAFIDAMNSAGQSISVVDTPFGATVDPESRK